MGVTWTHRFRAALAIAGALVVTVVVAAVALDESRPSSQALKATSEQAAFVAGDAQFYRDARSSLSPLLVHLTQQSQVFSKLLHDGAHVGVGVAGLATTWASDAATARDLVGRLRAPAAARPVQNLYRIGASLYVESARTLGAAATAPVPLDEVRAARRLQLLGDSVFDAGHRRLVPLTDVGSVPVDRPAAAVVPDFAGAGVGVAALPGPVGVTPVAARDEAAAVAQRVARWLTGGPAPPGGLEMTAATLRAASDAIGAAVNPNASQGDVLLRLAALVEAEAVRGPAVSDATRRLHLLAAALWSAGLADGAAVEAIEIGVFPTGGLDAGLLDGGGLFNGHPPALAPDDPPDKGVPGGLPSLGGLLGGVGGPSPSH